MEPRGKPPPPPSRALSLARIAQNQKQGQAERIADHTGHRSLAVLRAYVPRVDGLAGGSQGAFGFFPQYLGSVDATIAGLWMTAPGGVGINAPSGHNYTIPVPEPDRPLLFLLGAGMLLLRAPARARPRLAHEGLPADRTGDVGEAARPPLAALKSFAGYARRCRRAVASTSPPVSTRSTWVGSGTRVATRKPSILFSRDG